MQTEKDFENSECEDIGPRLRAWRKKKGFKLNELVSIIGISQGSMSDIENSNAYPSYKTMARYQFFFPGERWMRIFFG